MKLEQLRAQLKQSAQEQQEQQHKWHWQRPERQQTRSRRKPRRSALAITRHPVFVPVLAGWGAALGGLSVAMLPGTLIASIVTATGLGALGEWARPALALIVAGVLGLAALAFARMLRRERSDEPDEHILSAGAARRIHPIDPASELGSESLDAPLGESVDAPLEESLAAADAALEEDGEDGSHNWSAHWPQDEPFELDAQQVIDDEDAAPEVPELTLVADPPHEEPVMAEPATEAAAQQPATGQREKVWVIGSEAEVALPEEPEAPADAPAPAPASGIERLRQARTEDLSLVELVERFAAALHDHQQNARRRTTLEHTAFDPASPSAPARDAALAEALKALSQFTQGDAAGGPLADQSISRVGDTERALRNALARLQDMRGAA